MEKRSDKLPGFGIRLRSCRSNSDVTQQELADSLGVSLRTYQRYESGTTEPTLYDLVSICIVLGVSADYLLGLTDEEE